MERFGNMRDPLGAVDCKGFNVVVGVGNHDEALLTVYHRYGASVQPGIELDFQPAQAREVARLLEEAADAAEEA